MKTGHKIRYVYLARSGVRSWGITRDVTRRLALLERRHGRGGRLVVRPDVADHPNRCLLCGSLKGRGEPRVQNYVPRDSCNY